MVKICTLVMSWILTILSDYDIDHIIPQSFIRMTLLIIEYQVLLKIRGKSDDVPSLDIVRARKAEWVRLYKSD